MKTVFVYAGQGSQRVGMGYDFYNEYKEYRAVIDNLELGFDIKELMHVGSEKQLSDTRYTQACMAAFAAGVTNVLKTKGITPDAACGLSLGEYGALYAAGVFSEKDYVGITEFRGNAMADAAIGKNCCMSAIIGLESSVVEQACKEAQDKGMVELVNYNCPGQYVICGDDAAIIKAEEILREKGAKRCVRLNVSGPFHTKYMKEAADKLRVKLDETNMDKPNIPVVLNVTGDYYNTDDKLEDILERQVQNGVHFEESIARLINDGAEKFIEIGPGKTLSGFIKKTSKALGKSVEIVNIDKVEDIKKIVVSD